MKRNALFVGVDKYADGHIPDLSCAVRDATDLHGFFKYGAGYDRVELLPNPAGKKEVLDGVRDLTADLGPGDFFLFFFAGHGFRVGENHVLVCSKDLYDDVKYEDDGLPLGQLKRRLSGPFDRAILLDACQSDILATRGGEGIAERDLSLILDAPAAQAGEGTLTVVTSCDAGQTSGELSERRHGLFTLAMLDLLKEAQETRIRLDLSDVFRARLGLRMREIAARAGLSTEQRPRFSCTGGSCFVLLDGADPARPVPPASPIPVPASLVVCPVCGRKNRPEDTFRCRDCGRDNLCLRHQDETTFLCADCAAKAREASERREKATALVEEGKRFESSGEWARAAECFRQAAELGDKWACHKYGDLLCHGWYGVERDVSAAFGYYRKADPSVPWVQRNLGACHLEFFRRMGDPEEARQAVEWLRKSAEAGIPWACVELGDCYRDGIGVPQDFAQAASWYGRVAGRDPEEDYGATQWAEWNLGDFYRKGQGVERDLDKALGWYRKSAARKGDASERSAVAAAEVSSELLSARIKPALDSFWTSFREVAGVRIRDARGRDVPLAGLVASDRGIFVGLSLDGLRIGMADSLPDESPVPAFVSAVSEHCGLPMQWISGFVVVPDGFRIPGSGVLPPWAIRESDIAAGLLSVSPRSDLDWAHIFRDVIRKLETLPMSPAGAEKNALSHFEAPMPEWEDGAKLLAKVEAPSSRLVEFAQRAVVELDRAGNGTDAAAVFSWLNKFVNGQSSRNAQVHGTILTVSAAHVFFNFRQIPAKGLQAAFWMGETQVTQRLWRAVMGGNPSHFTGDERRPVEMVSWDDCQDFLKRLNALDEVRNSGFVFRLPTMEEWEHACRAGSTGKFCRLEDGTEITDASIGRVAWFDGNSERMTHPVGQKEPNAWGLYDMHGNVGEWTQTAADDGKRIERGGSCLLPAECCLSSGYSNEPPSLQISNLGFRLCADGKANRS